MFLTGSAEGKKISLHSASNIPDDREGGSDQNIIVSNSQLRHVWSVLSTLSHAATVQSLMLRQHTTKVIVGITASEATKDRSLTTVPGLERHLHEVA